MRLIQICFMLVIAVVGCCLKQGSAQQIRRTFQVSIGEPVTLHVELDRGDLQIGYARDGEVAITVVASGNSDASPGSPLAAQFPVVATNNHIEVRNRSDFSPGVLTYHIDVPYRTEVDASLEYGKAKISGILGPVNVRVGFGDIEASRISLGTTAHTRTGELNFDLVGGRIEAQTEHGNVVCQRASQGISAETGDGDIFLAVVGASDAIVKTGGGRIDAVGIRGPLHASASSGEIFVRAVPHDDWQLSSISGTVRVQLPHGSGFDLDLATNSGEVVIGRTDLKNPNAGVHHINEKANGGGKRIEVRTESGRIVIS
jgi:Putative adhesin